MVKALLTRWSAVAACALALAGCTVKNTERPELSGPSEFSLSFGVTATPDSLSQDGGSQSVIAVKAFGPNGAAKSGVTFRLDMVVNGTPVDYGTLSSKNVTTGSDGRAVVVYTAPLGLPTGANLPSCQPNVFNQPLPGGCLEIFATPIGSDFNGAHSESVYIHLMPTGVILPPSLTPTPSLTFNPAAPAASSPVQFDGSASCPGPASGSGCATSSGSITSYDWEFSDGGTASGRLAAHSFALAQTYSATLTVTNDRGVKASTTKSVPVGAGSAPTAAFVYSPTEPLALTETYFDASESRPGIGHRLVSYQWNWGDGELSPTLSNPYQSHDYLVAGKYVVVLTVTDEAGQIGTSKATLDVQ